MKLISETPARLRQMQIDLMEHIAKAPEREFERLRSVKYPVKDLHKAWDLICRVYAG